MEILPSALWSAMAVICNVGLIAQDIASLSRQIKRSLVDIAVFLHEHSIDISVTPMGHNFLSVPETMMIHFTDAYMRHQAWIK